eukprot:scaffold7578_cov121-Isochrysis_galbana.AAC.4
MRRPFSLFHVKTFHAGGGRHTSAGSRPLASRPSLAPPPAAHHPLPLRLPTPMFNSAALVGAPLSVRCEMARHRLARLPLIGATRGTRLAQTVAPAA